MKNNTNISHQQGTYGARSNYVRPPAGRSSVSRQYRSVERIGETSDGAEVYQRSVPHDKLPESLLYAALLRVNTKGAYFLQEVVSFDAVVGFSQCVSTTDTDVIVYAKRDNRHGLTRFVKNRSAEPSNTVVVILKKMEDRPNAYVLITAFVGSRAEPEPWDKVATPASAAFWKSHALIWGSTDIDHGSITNICPWGGAK